MLCPPVSVSAWSSRLDAYVATISISNAEIAFGVGKVRRFGLQVAAASNLGTPQRRRPAE